MNRAVLVDLKLLKFLAVGIVNTIVGSMIMFSLYNVAHCNYWLSSAMNYTITSFLSFFLNKYFTFNVKQWSVFMVISFAGVIIISYLLSYALAKLAINCLLKNNPQKIRENISLFTGMVLFTGLNYLGQRLIVFNGNNT
jgi:putative flippase GtrA